MSLDVPLGEPGSSASLGDLLPSGGDDYDDVENAMVLGQALGSLSCARPADPPAPLLRRPHPAQIGEEIGLSQMQVSRVLARILARLRALVAPTDAELDLSA